jgi:fibronectin-binding autotransporter adhesin
METNLSQLSFRARVSSQNKCRLLVLIFTAFLVSPALAQTEWSGGSTSNGNWSNGDNWGGAAPGDTTDTTSTDIAVFDMPIANTWGDSAANPVVIDLATQNIGSIFFDGSPGSYFIGSTTGNSLLLTNNGKFEIFAGTNNEIETINAPLVIEGSSATAGYTFQNNSSTGSAFDFGGGITAGSGTTGTTTLNLTGTTNTVTNMISGVIGNGGGRVAVNLASNPGSNSTWELTGVNTYSGATTINGGTLEINNSSALGDGSVTNTINLGGTLEFTTNNITLNANQAIKLTNNGTIETDVNYGASQALEIDGAINTNGHTLTLQSTSTNGNNPVPFTVSGIISGSGGLSTVTNGGNQAIALHLTGDNTYDGVTNLSSGGGNGGVYITAADNLGDGSVNNSLIFGGALYTTGTFDLGVNRAITIQGGTFVSQSGTLTVSGSIDDSVGYSWGASGAGNVILSGGITETGGQFTYSGSGTLFLTGDNTGWNKPSSSLFGMLQIGSGTVSATTEGLNGTNPSGTVILGYFGAAGTTLQAGAGGLDSAHPLDLAASGNYDTDGTNSIQSGVIENGIPFADGVFTTTGVLTVEDSSGTGTGTLSVTGANTYTGGTVVASGTLYADSPVSTGTGSTGTGAINVLAGAKLGGSGLIKPGAGNGITLQAHSTLISGDVQAAVSPTTLAGAGLTLDNTTAAATIVDASLGANIVFSLGYTATTPAGGFTVDNPNMNSTFMTVLGNTAGELKFALTGDTITLDDLTGNNLLFDSATSYLLIATGSNSDYTGLTVADPDANGNGVVTNITLAGSAEAEYGNLQLYLNNGDLEVVATPEPGTWALLGLGVLALAWRMRRAKVAA